MSDRNDAASRLRQLVDQRVALETKLQKETGELSESAVHDYDGRYQALQRQLAGLFKEASDDPEARHVLDATISSA